MKQAVQRARNGEDPGEMLALTYRSQVVNGFQYVVKVKTADNVFLLLKILQPPGTTRANAQFERLKVTDQIPIDF
ncbi:Hypothetical predicted protein [Mytilus galloprovincialis]|nr:Hypothetical predicted protein [Mytilus galloprovincialis]